MVEHSTHKHHQHEGCLFFTSEAQNHVFQRTSILQGKALGIIAESSNTQAQGAAHSSSRGSFLGG